MSRKRNSRTSGIKEEKKAIYVFLEGDSEDIYFKFIKNDFEEKLAKIELFRCPKGGSDVFTHIQDIARNKKYMLSEVDQIWIVFDTEDSYKDKWEYYRKLLKNLLGKNLKKVKLLMTSKDIEYFFLLHYEFKQPLYLSCDFEKELKRYQKNYKKTDEKIIGDIYSKRSVGIKNSKRSVLKILEYNDKEYKAIKESNYDFYKIFFETDYTFSLIFQAFEYLESL